MVVAMAMALVFLPDKAARRIRRVLRIPGGPKVLHLAPGGIGKYIPWYMIPNVPDWEHGEVYAMAHDPQEVYTMAYDSHGSGERTPLLRNMGNHIPVSYTHLTLPTKRIV